MKTLILSVLLSLSAISAQAKVDVIKADEELKSFSLKDQILNTIVYDYYDYDSSFSDEEWEQLVNAGSYQIVEKTLSSLPEGSNEMITTKMKVMVKLLVEDEAHCEVRMTRFFPATKWQVNKGGEIVVEKTDGGWNLRVLGCSE